MVSNTTGYLPGKIATKFTCRPIRRTVFKIYGTHDLPYTARPNFFCDIDSLNYLLEKEFEGDYKDIDLTMDLIELPYYFVFSTDEEKWTVKAMKRGEIYSHDDGIEKGSVVINKTSGEGEIETTQELGENMGAFFVACKNLSYYMQDNNLEEICADFDPEEEGIMLYVEDNELKYKVVSGEDGFVNISV